MGFLTSLYRLVYGDLIDLALRHGAAPLSVIATEQAIYAPAWDGETNIDDWAAGRVDRLRRDLGDEAFAIWRLAVRTAGLIGIDAEAATDAWATRRGKLSVVRSPNDAD